MNSSFVRFHHDIGPVVYFLFDDDELVYVGQTACLGKRIYQHFKDKTFNNCFYLRTGDWEVIDVESTFIRLLIPKYNRSLTSKSVPLSEMDKIILNGYGLSDLIDRKKKQLKYLKYG